MGFWKASNGALITTDNGANIVFNTSNPPPQPLDPRLARILAVRSLIDDPLGAASLGVGFAPAPPETAAPGTIWTAGDGLYTQKEEDAAWTRLPAVISDGVLATLPGGVFDAARSAVARLIAALNPADFITSFNTGGQSVSFSSFEDLRNHFFDLQHAITAVQGATMKAHRFPAPVGGYYD